MSGIFAELGRDLLRLKVLALIVTAVALLEAFALVFLSATVVANRRTMEMMSENIELRATISSLQSQYNSQTRKLCRIQIRMGDGYRRVLSSLVKRFGLDKRRPRTVANALLDEFEDLGVSSGMGGS